RIRASLQRRRKKPPNSQPLQRAGLPISFIVKTTNPECYPSAMPPPDHAASPLDPGPALYLVATPIGNLEDITLRAIRILKGVDVIACEDTRQTQKLLHHYGIATRTISYHEHNERGRAEELAAEFAKGARIAVVTDAGMPGVSDPGFRLVQQAIAQSVPVIP